MKEFSNPETPQSVEDRLMTTFEKLPKKRKRPKMVYGLIAAVLGFSLISGATFMSPALASTLKSMPFMDSLFELFGDEGVQHADKEGLGTEIYEVFEYNDKRVTFTNYIYDGNRFALEFKLDPYDSILPEEKRPYNAFPHAFYINDTFLNVPSMKIRSVKMADGSYTGVMTFSPSIDLPEEFTFGMKGFPKSDDWFGQINIKHNTKNRETVLNKVKKYGDIEITYQALSLTPLSTALMLDFENESKMDDKLFDHNKNIKFFVLDDEGNIIDLLDISSHGVDNAEMNFDYKGILEPLDKTPSSITIKPYLTRMNDTDFEAKEYQTNWKDAPATIATTDDWKLEVSNVQRNKSDLQLTFKALGDVPYRNLAVKFVDDTGKDYWSEPVYERITNNKYEFQLVFKDVPQDKNLDIFAKIYGKPQFVEELEIEIPVEE